MRPVELDETALEADLKPEERKFCLLRVRGYNQSQAYRVAFKKHRAKSETVSSEASKIAARPRVFAYIKRLFREAKKSDILSHTEYLEDLRDLQQKAVDENNLTAAASFARLVGQALGALEQKIILDDERLPDEELLKRLAGHDPAVAEQITRLIEGKREFDA